VLASLLILLIFITACTILFSLAQALAGSFLGATVEEVGLFSGKELGRFSYRGIVFRIGLLPIGSHVKFVGERQPDDFHNGFYDLHPVRRIAILFAGPAILYLVAVLCLGPSKASPKVGRGFVQFVLPIVPRATALAGGTPRELLARLLTLPQDQPSRVVLGIVASKLTALNLFPIPPSCGGTILMTLLGWRKRLPQRAEVALLTVGLTITVCLMAYWLVLIASFALKRT
jgi:membrane-associated protease RseP (regulator of RpoE activity)